jgi:hypothetical protein
MQNLSLESLESSTTLFSIPYLVHHFNQYQLYCYNIILIYKTIYWKERSKNYTLILRTFIPTEWLLLFQHWWSLKVCVFPFLTLLLLDWGVLKKICVNLIYLLFNSSFMCDWFLCCWSAFFSLSCICCLNLLFSYCYNIILIYKTIYWKEH